MDYASAVTLLKDPKTWKQAARMLAATGNPQALFPLTTAYEMRVEGNRQSLLAAMQAFNPVEEIPRLFEMAASDEERRKLVHLMELFPSRHYHPHLAQAAKSEDAGLRYQAGRSLYCQPRTEEWEQLMCDLLHSPDNRLRGWVIDGLGVCQSESARLALREHLNRETDPDLLKKVKTALEG
jgi:HEAT repeat protein